MAEKRYIHIVNWDVHQHPDTTRNKTGAIPWIKSYTGQLGDEDYLALNFSDRGLLESLRLQYAARRGRGISDSTASLCRLFGQRVMTTQLERLNHAGFIHFSASKSLASRLQDASPEVETEREVETEQKQEQHQTNNTPNYETTTDGWGPQRIDVLNTLLAAKGTTG